MMETPKNNLFSGESVASLITIKSTLIHILNLAEDAMLGGSEDPLDVQAYNNAEQTLHQVQRELDTRAV